jgi:hypothetical protein
MTMKKIYLILMAVTLMGYTINAQDNGADVRDKLQFGLKAGINLSNVYDAKDQTFNADLKVGFAGGAFLAIPFGKYFGFQPEIIYSQKGYKSQGSILTIPYIYTHTTNYIDVPLLLAIRPVEHLTLLFGPEYSFLISQKDVFTSGGLTFDQEQTFKNDKSVFCLLSGVDLDLNHIVLSARAGWDMQNNNGDGTSTNPRYKNVWYQVTLGFKF